MSKIKNKEGMTLAWLIGAGVFALIGIASFVIGYGLKDGWDAVIAWFTSKWAMWVYVFAAAYAFILLGYVFWKKNRDMIDGK